MPNFPVKSRCQDYRRPPRLERRLELNAFRLGFAPYHALAELWYFYHELSPAEERELLDLPVHLEKFLSDYTVVRLGETAKEVVSEFKKYPTVQPLIEPCDEEEIEDVEFPLRKPA